MVTRMQALLPRTGQGAVEDAAAMPQVVALMQIFAVDACRVAAAYAFARGRNEVGEDMRKALMYTTRAFFDQEDSALLHRLDEELRAEHDTDTSNTSETASDTSDADAIDHTVTANTANTANTTTANTTNTANTANTANSPPRGATPARQMANTITRRALRATLDGAVRDRTRDEVIARRVDDAVAGWAKWHPSDPVFRLLKRAVDSQSAA